MQRKKLPSEFRQWLAADTMVDLYAHSSKTGPVNGYSPASGKESHAGCGANTVSRVPRICRSSAPQAPSKPESKK